MLQLPGRPQPQLPAFGSHEVCPTCGERMVYSFAGKYAWLHCNPCVLKSIPLKDVDFTIDEKLVGYGHVTDRVLRMVMLMSLFDKMERAFLFDAGVINEP